ncbi:MAG: structural protein P5 [Alistipes sp.]|nr:structural protein P5 [Alistipes sp.]
MPRGLRNCNPGNIRHSTVRYKGEVTPCSDKAFRQFESMAWGYRAMFVLLHTYAKKHGCYTIRSIISRYAPPSENNTEAYIRRVSLGAGIDDTTRIETLDHQSMIPIVCAMSEVENGVTALRSEVEEGWRLFRADF